MATEPPPAPWRCEMTALLWAQRAPRESLALLPEPLRALRALPVALAGFVFYRDTPVGPYAEVFAAAAVLRGSIPLGHVPFMAVDSPPSVAAGRANWALPKEPARFAPAAGGAVTASGDGWTVSVRAAVRPRALPVAAAGTCAQPWPDGRLRPFVARLRGRARQAQVDVVRVEGEPAARWVQPGRRLAVVLSGALVVGPAR